MHKLYKNEYLFSEIYLEEITNFEEKPEVVSSLKTLKDYLEYANKDSLLEWKNSFIQKVFGVLGFGYKSITDNLIQLFVQGNSDNPISLCFTLLPSDDLDNSTIGKHWSEKIIRNLRNEKIKWGILTNGNKWRIYHVDEPTPYENYLEIDLEKILDQEDNKSYMIFFEFMKADNFIIGKGNSCKFDEFKEDSYDKIEYIEEELKNALKQKQENGKGVLSDLCMGYVEFLQSKSKKDFSDESYRKEIYSGAMLYMFRLLFVFYASARDLLTNAEIESFHKILIKSRELFKSNKASHKSYNLWEELRGVFGIIDLQYNGGLFDPQENKLIESNRVSDNFLCRVLYNMNYYEDEDGEEKPISYRDMDVRHLGTLYEGLLEHKLFLAEVDTEVKFVKNEIKFIPESEGGVIVEGKYIPKGQVYFGTDKFERKSTGSYFTPEYIVDYIVTNTVGEKLKELKEEFRSQNSELLEDIKIAPDEKEREVLVNELRAKLLDFSSKKILKLSVLDPAMGSGHFLVNAATKISNFIAGFLNEPGFTFEDTSSPIYWRRRVVENCIYGVDINPLAVELAKLSLWILSMAKDAHLSFLNHHLKCGNSLIGARLSDIGIYPGNKKPVKAGQISMWDKDVKFKQTVEKVINDYLAIEERETISKEDIEFKKELLDEINEALKPYKRVCDFHTSIYFDNDVDETEYFTKIKNTDLSRRSETKPEAVKVASNNYFHWELEFPEIFRTHNGFDCVIGNPPWGSDIIEIDKEKEYYRIYYLTTEGKFDFYKLFIERTTNFLHDNSIFSFITPNTWLTNKQATKLRALLLKKFLITHIYDYGKNAFEGVTADTIVFSAIKNTTSSKYVDVYSSILQKKIQTNQTIWLENSNHTINIHSDLVTQEILKLCNSHNAKLGDFSDMCQGVVPYSKSSFVKKYGKIKGTEIVDQRLFHSKNKKNNEWHLEISGKNVFRYKIEFDACVYIKYGSWLHRSRDMKYFKNPRIIIRRIFGKKQFIATFTNNEIIQSSLLHSILIDSNKFPIYYILGLINSKLLGYYFAFATSKQDITFPEVRLFELQQLPVPDCSEKLKTIIQSLVKVLLSIKPDKDKNDEIELVEKIIDFIVYQIYLFDEEEILIPEILLTVQNIEDQEKLISHLLLNSQIISAWIKNLSPNRFIVEVEE